MAKSRSEQNLVKLKRETIERARVEMNNKMTTCELRSIEACATVITVIC